LIISSLLDEREFTLSEVLFELCVADILQKDAVIHPIENTAESLSTLDFFQNPINEIRLTIRAWTNSSTVLEYLKRLSNYSHPSYDFPLGANLPQRLMQWSKLCREHYLDFSGFTAEINRMLICNFTDSRVFNEILRMKSYRVECCTRLCKICKSFYLTSILGEQLGSDLKDQVDEATNAVILSEKQNASDASLTEFFASTHMDSGVKILRLGLAELASQVYIFSLIV
jgi:hypothetical protein